MNNEVMNAYFAGLIDGEGTINVYPHKSNSCMRPVVKLNMTCRKTVESVHAYFGGSFMEKKVPEQNKRQWHWIVTFAKAVDVAEKIRPYLITKADLADKVLMCKKNPVGRPKKTAVRLDLV